MKKRIISGNVVEEFFVWREEKTINRGQRHKGVSDLRKIEANLKGAVKRLARTINCNYKAGDMLLTLTYDDEHLPKDRVAGIKDRDLFLRRLKRMFDKQGKAFFYIAVLGEKSSKTGEGVRLHHHILLPRADYELIVKNWQCGDVHYRLLASDKDYSYLAGYLLKNTPSDVADFKKYKPSRNLKKPIVKETPAKRLGPIVPPRGAEVMYRGEYDRERQKDYVRYVVRKRE